ncbi:MULTISPECIES: lysophospholipid acyltransferase family protein [unclassified Tolypothrix]|uniref:lysophospholipid acyltransferase family protein n=1 Tax=unclassified Tolypothrix TaxID=2649714 RepID=UPI0005EAB4D9|nr:putative phospholipid/glycerol acyltransferase [Tolypothrix sp. PCC 7601]BAY93077.1 putative acyltransferase [Microchaete diplosiphon NIES-3275]
MTQDYTEENNSQIFAKEKSNSRENQTQLPNVPPLTAQSINRVREGLAAAVDPAVRQQIAKTLQQLTDMTSQYPEPRVNPGVRRLVLRSLIHTFFQVQVEYLERFPQQPAILAVNHLHHIDPFLLLSEIPTAPYYYILGDARTLYNKWWKRFILGFAGGVIPLERMWKEEFAVIAEAKAGRKELLELATEIEQNVPKGTDIQTLRQIDRIVLTILTRGDGIVLFPEGRLGETEGNLHLPLKRGTVIYALKSGVPIVPVALIGTHNLYLRKKFTIRFGQPLYFAQNPIPKRQEVEQVLLKLQSEMQALLPTDYQEPTGPKLLCNFLNHLFW